MEPTEPPGRCAVFIVTPGPYCAPRDAPVEVTGLSNTEKGLSEDVGDSE